MKRIIAGTALVLALAGCGGKADTPAVATADGAKPTVSASAANDVVAKYVAEVREFVRCMRNEGFNLPDPGPKGEIDYSSLGLGAGLKKDPKFMAAQQTCSHLLPPVPEELEDKGPPLTAEQIEYARRYAKCMRANGVPEFPDPGPDGHFGRGVDAGASEQKAQAMFRAEQICRPVLEGRPPTTPNPNETGLG